MGHRSNLENFIHSVFDKPSNIIDHPSLRVVIDDDDDGQGNHYDCEKTWTEAWNKNSCGMTRVTNAALHASNACSPACNTFT